MIKHVLNMSSCALETGKQADTKRCLWIYWRKKSDLLLVGY